MIDEKDEGKIPPRRRLFVPSLAISALSIALFNTTVTLLFLEMAASFQVQEGIAAQIKTVNSIAEIVFALMMGFLAVKFKHKSLFLVGILFVLLSIMGIYFAPTFEWMLFFSFTEGTGSVIVTIMSLTIIGDSLPLGKKNRAVIWVAIGGFAAILIGTPIINLVAGVGNWRFPFLLFMLPTSIIAAILVLFGVPSTKTKQIQLAAEKNGNIPRFKEIFLNKSAFSYLVSNLFFTGAGNAVFIIAFFRLQFSLPRDYVVPIILASSSIYIISSLFVGRYVNRYGAKLFTIIGALVSGILLILMFSSTELWIAAVINFVQAFFTGMTISTYPCLALDQVPELRSTVMSLTRIFATASNAIVPGIGGALLVLFSGSPIGVGYQIVGLTLGIMNILSASILYFFTKDPTKL